MKKKRTTAILAAATVCLAALAVIVFMGRRTPVHSVDSEITQGMELIASFDFNDPVTDLSGAGAVATIHGKASYRTGRDGSRAASLSKNFWLEVTKKDGSPLLAGLDAFTVSYDSKPSGRGNSGWTFFAPRTCRPPKYEWESYLGIIDNPNAVAAERYHNFGGRPASVHSGEHVDGWRHVDVVFTEDSTKLYVDGVLVNMRHSDYSLKEVLSEAGGFLYIGRATWGEGEYFRGLIDNFKIWAPARPTDNPTDIEIAAPLPAVLPETEAYLFVHFTGMEGCASDEQIYFSVSRDGVHWDDLRPAGQPVLASGIGEQGVRDPFILRSHDGKKFYLIATDLSIYRRGGWGNSGWQTGSTYMVIWESEDLVHWGWPRRVDVAGGIHDAGMLWAPEAIYDGRTGDYFVFWATMSTTENAKGDPVNVYYSRTKDFHSFSQPVLWIDEESGIIDTTVIRAGDAFFRASRCDGILIERGESLTGQWKRLGLLEDIFGDGWTFGNVEGPELFLYNEKDWLNGQPTWGLFVDQYQKGNGYRAFRSTDLGDLTQNSYTADGDINFGEVKKRHGGVLPITMEEYERLADAFAIQPGSAASHKNPVLPGKYADPDIGYFEGKYYIYPTTDGFEGWSGHTFSVFSSDDLFHWEDEGVILDLKNDVPWSDGNAWAPAVEEKNGRYYFYFCGNGPTENHKAIGVAVADSPMGPFSAMARPLITMGDCRAAGVSMGQVIDPQIYTEDGVSYMLFGNGGAAIVQLDEDMVSWAPGTLRNISGAYGFREAIAVNRIDGLYHFTWSCDDTGSENYHVRYGVSDSLFGPIEHLGILLQKDAAGGILGTGHHAILYRPKEDDYYIAYHRFLTPLGQVTSGFGFHREVCIDSLEYRDGRFQPVKPSKGFR